ncbi:MAG TPA: PDZ domain-containing protein [Polyangiaceae bacterium]|jgi:membrane-associated protease RseP (regulator of RpoE activity)|nr:PDZ domain-containing protein [Polyangiaceae bacterium]
MLSVWVKPSFQRGVLGLAFLVGVALTAGCGAVYPEIATPVHPAGTRQLNPPPPEDIVFLKFAGAQIPTRTRDGRQWDSVGGSAPDPFAKLIIDDKEILITPVQANTLTPTWPDQKVGNYRLPRNLPTRVELWDSNPIDNHPICLESINDILGEASTEKDVEIDCDSGASITLTVQPAHAKFGIGLYYELETYDIFVTRVVGESPAARAGLKRGDQIQKIQGKAVKEMDEESARSLINSNTSTGVTLTIKHAQGGAVDDVTLKDGPMYPTIDEELKVE